MNKQEFWFAVVIGIAIGVVATLALTKEKPIPPNLPSMISSLRQSKAICEDWATIRRREATRTRNSRINLERGEGFYANMRADTDHYITYLQSSLLSGIKEGDHKAIRDSAIRLNVSVTNFRGWLKESEIREDDRRAGAETNSGQSGAATSSGFPPEILAEVAIAIMQNTSQRDDKIVEGLRSDMEGARLRPWNELRPD